MDYLIKYIEEFYGVNPKDSPDYGRIINEKKFETLASYLGGWRNPLRGDSDRNDLYIQPTILNTRIWKVL